MSSLETNIVTPKQNPPATAVELRHSLGITDNEDQDNWDDVDDWDSLLPQPTDTMNGTPVESTRAKSDRTVLLYQRRRRLRSLLWGCDRAAKCLASGKNG